MESATPHWSEAFDAAANAWAYYHMLEPAEQALIAALLCAATLAYVIDSTSKMKRRNKADEDIIQAALNEPVGQAARQARKTERALMERRRPMSTAEGETPAPKDKAPATVRQEPAPPQRIEPASGQCGVAEAVAELDFIKALRREDAGRLMETFGRVWVAEEAYDEARDALKAGGIDEGILAVCPGHGGKTAYSSVAKAMGGGYIVLSGSENVRRICGKYGILCVSAEEWRNTGPGL